MYKAIHLQTGEEIIILHPRWRKRIDELRAMDHEDLLVCQGCQQPLRVKSGEVKRAHFAHKHLKACSYGSETAEILNARAALFDWLLQWFGDAVTVEKVFEGAELPRPVDCWVETERGKFAYWIIETGIKLEPRQAIKTAFARAGIPVHWVFLSSMLNEEKKEFHSLYLTPTERTFLQPTPFDQLMAGGGEAGQSLHYLNAEGQALTTFRGLVMFHRPNWFKGIKKTSQLAQVRPDMLEGEFVHPGEKARLDAFRQKRRRLEDKRRKFQQREDAWEQHLKTKPARKAQDAWKRSARASYELPVDREAGEPQALPCATCGRITNDYWSTFFDEQGQKLCRCRTCLEGANPDTPGDR